MTYTVWATSLASGQRHELSVHDNLEEAMDAANIMLAGGTPVEITVIDSDGTTHFRRAFGNV
jgi:hypothetical protein